MIPTPAQQTFSVHASIKENYSSKKRKTPIHETVDIEEAKRRFFKRGGTVEKIDITR